MQTCVYLHTHIALFWRTAAAIFVVHALVGGGAIAQTTPRITALTVTPTIVVGGDKPAGLVTISAAAPTGGLPIRLASTSTSATVPTSVTVPGGQTSASFTVTTTTVTTATSAIISATNSSGTRTAILTINKTGARPQIAQGGSGSFRSTGSEPPASGVTWDITRNAAFVASTLKANGWAASFDTGASAMTVSTPFSAAVATGYKVRVSVSGNFYSALFDVAPVNAGILGNPMPPWAEDVRPVDSGAGGGGAGPSSADSVDLTTGVYENDPGPDIVARNPFGPSVSYARVYRSAVAQAGDASPGLSTGWVDNFDVFIQSGAVDGTWMLLRLVYPNGATEILTPVLSAGRPTGKLLSSAGAPYAVQGVPSSTTGRWLRLRIIFKDGSSWTFTPDPNNASQYLLTQISNLMGRSAFIHYDSAHNNRLLNVTNDAVPANVLLAFSYDGNGYLNQVTDINGRRVHYTFGPVTGLSTTCLLSVSQIYSSGAVPRAAWMYGYTSFNGQPYLNTVAVPDPNNGTVIASHPIQPDAAGRVNQLVDSSGNSRSYTYGAGQTTVKVTGVDGKLASRWTAYFDSEGKTTGVTDALGHTALLFYEDAKNPEQVTRSINRNGQQDSATFDQFRNPLTETNTRGIITTYGYDYSIRPTGLLTSLQVGAKTPVHIHYYPNGLVQSVDTPQPGTSGTSQWVTTLFSYTLSGNLASVIGPPPNTTGIPVTVTLNYVYDPADGTRSPEILGQPLTITWQNNKVGDPAHFATFHKRYDLGGNVVAEIDPLGFRTDYLFNNAHQLVRTTYPATGEIGSLRAQILNVYDYVGGPLKVTYVFNEANAVDRVYIRSLAKEGETTTQSGSAETAKWLYDGDYRLSQSVDGNNNAVGLNYDLVGNLLNQVYPGGDAYQIPHSDPENNPLDLRDANGKLIRYTRASDDSRITHIFYSDPLQNVVFDHDIYGRVTHMADGTGTTDWTYDDLDNVMSMTTTYTGLPAATVSYTYFPDGSRASMTTPIGTCNYTYDLAGRVTAVANPWGPSLEGRYLYTYDDDDRIIKQHQSLVDFVYSYDQRGRLTEVQTKVPGISTIYTDFVNMTYDSLGNRVSMGVNIPAAGLAGAIDNRTQPVTWTYDNKGRLTSEVGNYPANYGGNFNYSFIYDPAGNIVNLRGTTQSYNPKEQITTSGGYTYDRNGNPTTYQGMSGWLYDLENRLISVPGMTTAAWRGDGLRAWKANSGGTKEYFLYDGNLRVTELDASGNVNHAYGYGPMGLVQRETPGGSTFYRLFMFDPNGNLAQRFDSVSGTPLDIAVYDGFGMIHGDVSAQSGSGYLQSNDPVGAGSQWGNFTDEELRSTVPLTTGLPQDPDGNYYDPLTGRRLTRKGGYNPNLDIAEHALDYAIAGIGEGLGNWAISSVVGAFTPPISTAGLSPAQAQLAGNINARLYEISHPFEVGNNPIERGFAGAAGLTADALSLYATGAGAIRAAGATVAEAASVNRQAAAVKGAGCFVAGTPVQSIKPLNPGRDSTSSLEKGTQVVTIPVDQVKTGDVVVSRNETTGKTENKHVLSTTERTVAQVYTIRLANRSGKQVESITATGNHPFYVAGQGFVKAERLGIGCQVVTRAGPVLTVAAVDCESRAEGYTVYNIEVEDYHTYFVGSTNGGAWVHNPVDCAQSIVPARMQTIDFRNPNWRSATLQGPVVYVLRDLKSGELLKVGSTHRTTFRRRFPAYVAAGNRTGRHLGVDVFEVSGARKWTIEKEMRDNLDKMGHTLIWDNSGGRLGRPGSGLP